MFLDIYPSSRSDLIEIENLEAELINIKDRAEKLRLAVVDLYELDEFEVWGRGFAGHEAAAKIIKTLWDMVGGEHRTFL